MIWYDSVIDTGELKWQDELNLNNKDFFDVSDGVFTVAYSGVKISIYFVREMVDAVQCVPGKHKKALISFLMHRLLQLSYHLTAL